MRNALLAIYSSVVSAVLALLLINNSSVKAAGTSFDQITVHRINVVEPDGTLRMVISDHASFPGLITHGKEQKFERPQAGMLFYNDEGSEAGGLIFGGHKNAQGQVVDSGGSLSFDRYDAKQIVQVMGVDDKDDRFAGLMVSDSPRAGESHRRIWAGRDDEGTASIALMDAQGRKRILMQVLADGTPSLSFLDEHGKILNQLVPKPGQ
jgi:hypothetical protein